MYMINKKPKPIPKKEYCRAYKIKGDLHPSNVILECDYDDISENDIKVRSTK